MTKFVTVDAMWETREDHYAFILDLVCFGRASFGLNENGRMIYDDFTKHLEVKAEEGSD